MGILTKGLKALGKTSAKTKDLNRKTFKEMNDLSNKSTAQLRRHIAMLEGKLERAKDPKRGFNNMPDPKTYEGAEQDLKSAKAELAKRERKNTTTKFNKGGMANCGASMKATQKSTANMAYGGMARKK
jgi:hypothetical protein